MSVEKTTLESKNKPVLSVTRYERVSSTLIAVVIALMLTVGMLFVIWLTNRPKPPQSEAVLEVLELTGGAEDGAPDETLRIDSPEEVTPDPSIPEIPSDETQIAEAIESVIELSDDASMQLPPQYNIAVENMGKAGSAIGTGRRALGSGPGEGGFPRHQRWYVRFADRGTIEEYARQLDYFGIELGLLNGTELVYVSNLSSPQPTVRRANTGKGENRLYFTWQGGKRRGADLELLKKAGLDAGASTIFHFYPPKTEQLLAKAELQYRNKKVKEIRRTFYALNGKSGSYEFEVTNQAYY